MNKIFSIIVTYNGAHWIEKCLHQLFESNIKTDVIVVDNGSSDNTLDLVNSFQNIHLIINKVNTGFGQANNLGINFAMKEGADFIFLLNQDAYVFDDTVFKLTEALKHNPAFGLLSPLQLEVTGKNIEPIFKKFLRKNFSEEIINKMLSPPGDFEVDKPYPMRFVNAAAWMISRNCINSVGLFHPAFFHYGEDNNYAARVQYHGMRIGVLPSAHVVHDCKTDIPNSYNLLIRKIKNVPLYTLLDLRKSFPVAYVLGYLKWRRLANKLSKLNKADSKNIVDEQKAWFTSNLSKAMKIRKETKKPSNSW